MTAAEEPTLYDVLEVDPASSLDELRVAVERARETYGPESLAVYALVDDDQMEELRAKLDEAASVLLDPVRRASYDRSIGRIGPSTLWAEDDEDDDAPLPPVQPGPHARAVDLALEPEAEDEEEPVPAQQALALEVPETPGPFGRAAAAAPASEGSTEGRDEPAKAPLLSGDWASAVPGEHPAMKVASEPEPTSSSRAATDERTPAPGEDGSAGAREESRAAEPGTLPPALGLRIRPVPSAPEPVAPAEPPPPPAAAAPPEPVASMPTAPPELPTRPRESRLKLDIPSDAEFNGELLRRVRESYGLSLQQVAERTRITRIHLENVEADRYDRLPATVYLRGILVNLARELRLDPARVSKTYLLAAQRSHARAP